MQSDRLLFTTPRFTCTPLDEVHREDYCALYGDKTVMKYIADPFSHDFASQHFDMVRAASQTQPPSRLCWAIQRKDGEFVGVMGFIWDEKLDTSPFIGIVLRASTLGKGYSHELFSALIAHAFSVLGIQGINAFIHPDNVPVKRMVQKVGFHVEPGLSDTDFGSLHRCRISPVDFPGLAK